MSFQNVFNPLVFPIIHNKTNSFEIELENQHKQKFRLAIIIAPNKQTEMFIEDYNTNERLTTQCKVYMKHKYGSLNIHCEPFGNEYYEQINYTKDVGECSGETKCNTNADANADIGEIIYLLNNNNKYVVIIENNFPFCVNLQKNFVLIYN
jgi:hypothetical protein